MSVLSPSDSVAEEREIDPRIGPPPATRTTRTADLVDELRRRALGIVATLTGLGLVALLVVAVTGSTDRGDDLATTPPSAVEPPAADSTLSNRAAGREVVPVDDQGTAPVTETTATEPTATSGPTSTVPESAPGPPTTAAAAEDRAAPTSATDSPVTSTSVGDSTTAPPSTTPTTSPSTTAPTTPSTTTTTAGPSTTAAPTTPPPTTSSTAPPGSVEQQILALVNAERAAANCGAVALNAQLTTAADDHSEDMAANGYFSHTGLDGSQPWDRARAAGYSSSFIGENIAQGYGSAEAVMNGWMNSSGHRANILNCGFQDLGVGLSSQGNYWTQLFGGG